MKHFLVAIAAFVSAVSFSFGQSNEINIIPQPSSVQHNPGHFVIDRNIRIVAARTGVSRYFADLFNQEIQKRYGYKLSVVRSTRSSKHILFNEMGSAHSWERNSEEYLLIVNPDRIQVLGHSRGLHHGYQTLLQLLPIDSKEARVPAVRIKDAPRFPYRGMHLDVARHFQPVEFVKKYIDLMSQYKFNYFHWHLTEDQGWRVEIKKYPKLTEIGSKRPETMVDRNFAPYIGDGIPHGGFYTQEQIKEVVKYAKERHITVIPEIELPGHASAALAAYPQFGCKADYQYKVQTTWGIFKEVFCPTEETFKFLEDVLTETIALFPDSPYIHIGGDEVLKDHWKESAFVQELKKRENLKDEHEVQSYFIRRIEKFLNSKGKKMIGWDEILEGGLAPNATVMSWRGMRGGIEAAKSKHDVIMTPTDYVYFDYGQGDPAYEPLNIGSYVPLSKVYSFEPVPPDLTPEEAKYVIGGQANVWTEYMKTPSHVEYMAFPRMMALSEVLWSRKEDRDFTDFQKRLNAVLPRLDKQNVNYRIPEPGGLKNMVVGNDGKATIELSPAAGTRVYYTLDGSTPDEKSLFYSKPFTIELKQNEKVELKTVVANSKGRKSVVYAATLIRRDMLPPVEPTGKTAGVTYSLYVPSNAYAQDTPAQKGESRSIGLQQFAQRIDPKQTFGVTFEGYLNIPADGIYEFQIDSTWDRSLSIDDVELINEAGTKDRTVKSAIIPLKAGWHKLAIHYDHREGEMAFRVRWGIKGQGLRQIGGGELVH